MKKKLILTLAMTAVMSQATFAADATSSASTSTSTSTSKPATSTGSSKSTTTSKTTSSAKSTTTVTTKRSTATPKEGDIKYTVVWGDTLNDIAAKYNTTAKAIADYNGIKDVNKIYAGEIIYIPAPKTTTVTPEKPVVTTPVTPTVPAKPVTPQQPITDPVPPTTDAVTTPSITDKASDVKASLGENGNWITCTTADVTIPGELVVEGTFYNKDDKTKGEYRKLGLYTQDAEKKVTGEFALNVDKMTVKSPNFKIQNGTVNGDIYVDANGFTAASKVNGNIVFSSPEAFATADLSKMTLGEGYTVTFENPIDATTQPSITADPEELQTALSSNGRWIATTTDDVTIDGELVVDGNFYNKDDYSKGAYRKLGLYTQDENKKVTDEFELTVDKMTVNSPNFKIQNGTVNGDIYVNAPGFTPACTVNGNIIFTDPALYFTADFSNVKMTEGHDHLFVLPIPGNADEYGLENTAVLPANELTGKHIGYLGSSVTLGMTAESDSFVDYIAKRNGTTYVKEAISGTTLVDDQGYNKENGGHLKNTGSSYVKRMERMDPNEDFDLFVVQLSTNDATNKKPLGTISTSTDRTTFDTTTIIGAMEYIISYAEETWDVPVVFYTGSYFDSPEYAAMVDALYELQGKYDITIIDMYTNEEFNNVSAEDYAIYMADPIHPTQAGYRDWWTPYIEDGLKEALK